MDNDTPSTWRAIDEQLACLAQRQLFFVGGAPRSGTTWLQQLLNAHPDICCRGEGLFQQELARPLEALMAARRGALAAKNTAQFHHSGGFALPDQADTEHLLGTAILLALRRQTAGRRCQAIGEKTPENVFLFPRLKRLFPGAKFIGIARDPRDSLTSAWHYWGKARLETDAQSAFVEASLPAVEAGLLQMVEFTDTYRSDCRVFTYESLLKMTEPIMAGLCRFLDVSDAPDVVARCVQTAEFAAQTGGRPRGQTLEGAFLRKGVAGEWRSTLPPELAAMIAARLDWAYDWFGWPLL